MSLCPKSAHLLSTGFQHLPSHPTHYPSSAPVTVRLSSPFLMSGMCLEAQLIVIKKKKVVEHGSAPCWFLADMAATWLIICHVGFSFQ